jgi:uncharacterized protein
MEKRVEFIGSIIIFFILLFVYSKFGPSLPVSVLTQTKGEPMMVSDTGKVTVVPDIAKVTLGIDVQGQNLKQIQSEVNTKSKTLTDSLKKLGIAEKDIKTTNYSVNPEYDYTNSPYKINGYRVTTTYEVKITDFELVNDTLVMATESGANVIGNISFEVNEETKEKKLQEAREIAVDKAKQKAEGLAKASGITLGKIINVTESMGYDYPRPIAYAKEMSLSSGDSPEVANVTPGETEISVTISLSYEIR